MAKHVVIVGAGFAGLELAARLSESVADEVRVTLIDRNDSFHFGFSKLDVLLAGDPGRSAAALPVHLEEGVEFRQETLTAIDPRRRRVTTDQGSYDADFLGSRWERSTTRLLPRVSRRAALSTTRWRELSACARLSPTSLRGRT